MAKETEATELREVNGVWIPVDPSSPPAPAPRRRFASSPATGASRDRHGGPSRQRSPVPATAARPADDVACVVCGAPATFGIAHGGGVTPICSAHAALVRKGQQAAQKQVQTILTKVFSGIFGGR